MFVAQCGLNELNSKKYYAEKMSAQDDELKKILAERDELAEKCKALENKISNLEWANKMNQTVIEKLQKNKAQG